jgi:hypothetical protein
MLALRLGVTRQFATGAARCVALGALFAMGGCASDEEYRRKVYGDPQQQMAMRGPVRAAKPVEVEEDGLPSQVAPPPNRKSEPDDPNEPFSPNYGGSSTGGANSGRPVTGGRAAQPVKAADAYVPPVQAPMGALRGPAPAGPAVSGWRQVAGQ